MYLLEIKNKKPINRQDIPNSPFEEFEKNICAKKFITL